MDRTAERCLDIYVDLIGHHRVRHQEAVDAWRNARRLIRAEWALLKGLTARRAPR
jgi:hypothetical protein